MSDDTCNCGCSTPAKTDKSGTCECGCGDSQKAEAGESR